MNIIGIEFVFLVKAIFFGLAAIIMIPQQQFQRFFRYGLILGGIGEVLNILIFGFLLGGFRYKNMGVFNILNLTSFWTPISWMFVMMYFLYNLPLRKNFFYLYIICFGFFGYCVGLVLENFNLFNYRGVYNYLAPLILSGLFYLAALFYLKSEKLKLQ